MTRYIVLMLLLVGCDKDGGNNGEPPPPPGQCPEGLAQPDLAGQCRCVPQHTIGALEAGNCS